MMNATAPYAHRPCLVCGEGLSDPESAMCPDEVVGTRFTASGNYGSGVWDPMTSGQWLEIQVCDPCLTAAGADGKVRQIEDTTKRSTRTNRWPAA